MFSSVSRLIEGQPRSSDYLFNREQQQNQVELELGKRILLMKNAVDCGNQKQFNDVFTFRINIDGEIKLRMLQEIAGYCYQVNQTIRLLTSPELSRFINYYRFLNNRRNQFDKTPWILSVGLSELLACLCDERTFIQINIIIRLLQMSHQDNPKKELRAVLNFIEKQLIDFASDVLIDPSSQLCALGSFAVECLPQVNLLCINAAKSGTGNTEITQIQRQFQEMLRANRLLIPADLERSCLGVGS